jgi:hypothetical protein
MGPTPPGTGVMNEAFKEFRTPYSEIIIPPIKTYKPFLIYFL